MCWGVKVSTKQTPNKKHIHIHTISRILADLSHLRLFGNFKTIMFVQAPLQFEYPPKYPKHVRTQHVVTLVSQSKVHNQTSLHSELCCGLGKGGGGLYTWPLWPLAGKNVLPKEEEAWLVHRSFYNCGRSSSGKRPETWYHTEGDFEGTRGPTGGRAHTVCIVSILHARGVSCCVLSYRTHKRELPMKEVPLFS